MEEKSNEKDSSKAKFIAENYKFKNIHSYSQKELIGVVKELTHLCEEYEKILLKDERIIEKQKNELQKLKEQLAIFYSNEDNLQKFVGYDINWLYIDKICFIIERSNKPLHSHQVVDLMLRIEPNLKLKLINPFNSITKAIYNGVKLNRLVKHQKTGNFGFTYLLS